MENALIYKFQSGFLPGHSTTHHLIEHINVIFMALDYRERKSHFLLLYVVLWLKYNCLATGEDFL
jgi:hypothetical protein